MGQFVDSKGGTLSATHVYRNYLALAKRRTCGLPRFTLPCIALHCPTLICITLQHTALCCVALRCPTLMCRA